MTESPRGPLQIATALLQAIVRALAQMIVYLGPLLAEACGYLARLCADGVSAVRALILRRRRQTTPASVPECDRLEAALVVAKAKRWAAWRALPVDRRLSVQAAAALLVVSAFLAIRMTWLPAPQPAATFPTTIPETDSAPSPRDSMSI